MKKPYRHPYFLLFWLFLILFTPNSFAHSNVTTSDFQSVCENIYGGSLAWLFDQWIFDHDEWILCTWDKFYKKVKSSR